MSLLTNIFAVDVDFDDDSLRTVFRPECDCLFLETSCAEIKERKRGLADGEKQRRATCAQLYTATPHAPNHPISPSLWARITTS